MIEIIYFSIGVVSGTLAVLLASRTRLKFLREKQRLEVHGEIILLQQNIKSLKEDLQTKNKTLEKSDLRLDQLIEEKGSLREALVGAEVTLNEERRHTVEKFKNLEAVKEGLKSEFENLAERVLEKKSEKFSQQHKERLSTILNPLRNEIGDFKKKVEDSYEKEARERHSLKNEIENLQKMNNKMSQEAVNLTRALKGDNRSQGVWGEMVLERVLDSSGLRKGMEYDVQGSYNGEDGKRYRPDVIVHLPDKKDVIVDSKVSLKAYEKYCSEDDPQLKAQWAAEHLSSVKNHLSELSEKAYEQIPGINCLDYVIMFMPVEGAFGLAMELDDDLFIKAMKKNIMIVSPSSLLVALRTINKIWQYENQNQNALKIASKAELMYKKFVLFVEELSKVGQALSSANSHYENAYKRLSLGRDNLVKVSEDIKAMGVPAKRSLQPELIAQATDSGSIGFDKENPEDSGVFYIGGLIQTE